MFGLFSKKKKKNGNVNFQLSNDIPRYPPFSSGLPAVSVEKLMQSQNTLIMRIQSILRFNQAEFNNIIIPVIKNYAAYVHLLPASESHHHQGAGGLFRHGLEVAMWAAQSAESRIFDVKIIPEQRQKNEIRWQLAAFLGGLLHDVGKPLTDVVVVNAQGDKTWNQYDESIATWLEKQNIDRYFLRWQLKRNKRHEKFAMMNLDRILTSTVKTFLNHNGPVIIEAMLDSLVSISASGELSKLIIWADQESVKKDLLRNRIDIGEFDYGVPIERYIFDALRQLVSTIKINIPGALIWHTNEGLFLVWKNMVKEILNLLDKDSVLGIPREPTVLADILIEKGFASSYVDKDCILPYWRIYPAALKGIPLTCLKLESAELIFTSEPPAIVEVSLITPQNAVTNSIKIQSKETLKQKEINEKSIPTTDNQEKKTPIHEHQQAKPKEKKAAQLPILVQQKKQSRPIPKTHQSSNASASNNAQSDQSTEPRLDNFVPELRTLLDDAICLHDQSSDPIFTPLPNKLLGIAYPSAAKLIGDPKTIINLLFHHQALSLEAVSNAKISTIGGKKYLALLPNITKYVQEKITSLKRSMDQSASEDAVPVIKTLTVSVLDKILVEQLMKGYGHYLDHDVECFDNAETKTLQTNLSIIKNVAADFDVSEALVRTLLRRLDKFSIIKNEAGKKILRYSEKKT